MSGRGRVCRFLSVDFLPVFYELSVIDNGVLVGSKKAGFFPRLFLSYAICG